MKALSDRSGDRGAGGRRFHVAGRLTAKLRCPVAVRARGTSRVPVAAGRTDGQKQRLIPLPYGREHNNKRACVDHVEL